MEITSLSLICKVKAVFPGGPAFSMVTADQLDLTMDFDSLKKAGTGLGSAGVIVVDDATCMVDLTQVRPWDENVFLTSYSSSSTEVKLRTVRFSESV